MLTNLLSALICGIALSLIYRATYRGPSYSVSYVNALVLLTLIAALVIVVIGNNLARAFGLVGARAGSSGLYSAMPAATNGCIECRLKVSRVFGA